MDLVRSTLAGDRLSLARLLTQVENDTPLGRSALDQLFPHTGQATLIGVTGSPGAGKSSLVNQLALALRRPAGDAPPQRVAILAVDPTSPFSGGALLGDRVRMRDLSGDSGVFIRSMASRGSLGGLARSSTALAAVLDAAGFDTILIETVGAGQSEVDIARLAHTTIVVEAPGMGDEIQAIKAGILEIADILVINKADHPGVENTERALKAMLEMGHPHHPGHSPGDLGGEIWLPPVLRAIATAGEGVPQVVDAIRRHGEYLRRSGVWRLREYERMQTMLKLSVQRALLDRWQAGVSDDLVEEMVAALCERRLTPSEALRQLVK